MRHASLSAFLAARGPTLAQGPLSLVMAEDEVEIDSTLAHQLKCGFRDVVLLAPEGVQVAPEHDAQVDIVTYDVFAEAALPGAVNQMMDAVAGAWVHYCYNAEYLFFPFCETRRIRELLAFHTEERREAMLTYVVDLYAGDLVRNGNAVALEDAWMDRSGYYALTRKDPARNWEPKDRQMDFFGGLRWRFEEHILWARRRIDRISLFRAKPGLRLLPDFTLSDEEMNTHACPWHHNLGSRHAIQSFRWHNSTPFDWHSQQLLDLGLMEPGQWF